MEAALEAAGIWLMSEHVQRRQATIAYYVSDRPIYNMYTEGDSMEGYRRFLSWWDQDNGPTQAEREVGQKRGSF